MTGYSDETVPEIDRPDPTAESDEPDYTDDLPPELHGEIQIDLDLPDDAEFDVDVGDGEIIVQYWADRVDVGRAERNAYHSGYNRFEDADTDEIDLEGYRETAEWSNNVLPQLRASVGYQDNHGVGTYRRDRIVYTTDGELIGCHHLLKEVVGAHGRGARDGAAGREQQFDPDEV